ncbi:MAG: hypothetical protein CMM91_01960 [Rickettsiales bacterium]|jgi:hypothetical protein|nr:hypothetical protein [Rickettsiales bacterium]|tara:strand:+ start:3717 stop:4013 length:297 start_codon:yes stop_codon:yes gene_type:complete
MASKKERLVWSKLKKKSPKVPDITCPAIDEVIQRIEDIESGKRKLSNRALHVIIKKLEKLRTANEKLRDSGYYWHHVAKDLVKDFYSKPKLGKFKFWK